MQPAMRNRALAQSNASDEVVSYGAKGAYGAPFVSDFRLVVPVSQADVDTFFSGTDAQDLRRVYNVPTPENVAKLIAPEELARPENASFATHCAAGLARVGVMTIAPSRLDAWGVTAEVAARDRSSRARAAHSASEGKSAGVYPARKYTTLTS